MEIKKEIVINKQIHHVWEVVGDQYADAYKWARGLHFSHGHGTPKFDGASCNNRTCEVPGFGKVNEVIRKYDPKNYVLSYEVVEGFPGFITKGVNTWRLTPQGGKTKVSMHLVMDTKGLKGAIMGPMMKMQLNKLIAGVVEDLKIFLETGAPSKQKQKEINKAKKKAA